MTFLRRVLAYPEQYRFDIDTLGACQIDSPVRNRVFRGVNERCVLTCDAQALATHAGDGSRPISFERAGPHGKIFHDPAWSRAAILTAGGLCPGLNHVIKGLVEILTAEYHVRTIYGIRYGYRGLISQYGSSPFLLDADIVDTIHERGGTILGSSRGNQDVAEMVETLTRMNINLLFCVGGDGTLRGARAIAEECLRRKLAISVVGIPKTIDNDLHFIGDSFGFSTAVGETSAIIQSAHMEAKGAVNGIGIVKLMGRDSGFIAACAALANPVVNFCLIPECAFTLDGPDGLLAALERRLAAGKDHAVIIVAEGAGQELIAAEPERRDASGNVLKKDIGERLRVAIPEYFAVRRAEVTIKYFDPSYSIRSVPAKGTDAVHCYLLARNAVHAAMAGRTNCVVGNLHGTDYTLVPIALAATERRTVDLDGDLWKAVLDATGQDRLLRGG
ncbi:MAG: ATP-dependent 6-phosphofructokinase [Kiritimatiellia bacterium]